MVKCTKGQIRKLKTALRRKIPAAQRERIQMVLLRESGMTQPAIAADPVLAAIIEPTLRVLEAARAQLLFYDRAVIQRARRDETARQLRNERTTTDWVTGLGQQGRSAASAARSGRSVLRGCRQGKLASK
jgi:hypothetical protein